VLFCNAQCVHRGEERKKKEQNMFLMLYRRLSGGTRPTSWREWQGALNNSFEFFTAVLKFFTVVHAPAKGMGRCPLAHTPTNIYIYIYIYATRDLHLHKWIHASNNDCGICFENRTEDQVTLWQCDIYE
jgi:hypothetical protein